MEIVLSDEATVIEMNRLVRLGEWAEQHAIPALEGITDFLYYPNGSVMMNDADANTTQVKLARNALKELPVADQSVRVE